MPWKPSRPGEVPTLGWDVLDWISEFLAAPDRSEYAPLVLTNEQARFVLRFYEIDPVTGRRRYRRGVWSRSKGHGKAECLTAELPTPTGWTTVGDVRPGDYLIGGDGRPVRVRQVHPVICEPAYRVTFSDGSSSVFHGEHLFTVGEFTPSGTRRTVTLSVVEMMRRGLVFDRPLTTGRTKATRGGVSRFALPELPAMVLPDADLPIDPYVLGYWLGDGDSDSARFTVGDDDLQHFLEQIGAIGYEHGEPKRTNTAWRVRVGAGWLQAALRDLGVWMDKHIPAVYLRASDEQRLALLQGLMDSDGFIESNGRAEFCTMNRRLTEDTAELLRTLGFRCNVVANRTHIAGRDVGMRYRIGFSPRRQVFRLPRKAERVRVTTRRPFPRVIKAIEPAPATPMRCLTVDAADGLYLTGRTMVTTHNSPMLAALAAAEALAPVVPAGWDAQGQPVGRPWADVRTPWVQLAAVSADQTRNSWMPLLEMLRDGPVVDEYPGVEPLETFVNLPRGRIEFVTSEATSREGNRPVFAVLDQTEEWRPSNGGVRLAATIRRNLGKTGGSSIESPNAYVPGAESVAEASAEYAAAIREGRAKDDGLLVDHREAPPDTDMSDRDSLLRGLEIAYGDSAVSAGGWVDLDRIVAEIWDPATNPQDARRYYLNQITHASDAWLSAPEWNARKDPREVKPGDEIVLGFDGSRSRKRGVTDATALIAARVSDGYLFQIGVWEQPDGVKDWRVPADQVDAVVAETFRDYRVVGFYADPARWESYVAKWEAAYGAKLRVKASRQNPIEWWMSGSKVVQALEQFESAVLDGDLHHDGASVLTRHVLNARRRKGRAGMTIAKEFPESPNKIDAAIAAVLAWQCRLDAVAQGLGTNRERRRARVVVL